jgi:methanogenic corrinoid protein MtbC1
MADKVNHNELVDLIAELHEDQALERVRHLIHEGLAPLTILDLCYTGLARVGEYYEKGRYAISGLIMAGEIMRQVGEMVFPLMAYESSNADSGKIVLGTVEGDIHFIGKDIFKTLARGHGFSVHDLGVDVSPSSFLSAIHDFKPDIVGFSCLISGAYDSLRDSLAFLVDQVPQSIQPRAYILGGRIDKVTAKHVGAQWWTSDAMGGIRLCKKILSKDKS